MAKSSARKTADAIHNIPEYYTGTTEPTGDQLKMGDMWFEEEIVRARSSGTPLPSISKLIEKRKRKRLVGLLLRYLNSTRKGAGNGRRISI